MPGVGAGRAGCSCCRHDYLGTTLPGIGTTRNQVKFWFGGPDSSTSLGSKEEIWTTLEDVFDTITSDDFDIDCGKQ